MVKYEIKIRKIVYEGKVVGYRISSVGRKIPDIDIGTQFLVYTLERLRGVKMTNGSTLIAFLCDGKLLTNEEENAIGLDSKEDISLFIADCYHDRGKETDLDSLLVERFHICWDMLNTAGDFPMGKINSYHVNTRLSTTWGRCNMNRGINTYNIEISDKLLLNGTIEGIDTTILHELLHTCHNAFNHGPVWKYYANLVGAYFGYDIETFSNSKDRGITEDDYIANGYYVCVCRDCGNPVAKKTVSGIIKYPHRYTCKCGGSFERVN